MSEDLDTTAEVHVIKKRNYRHKCILRLHEWRVRTANFKVDRGHKKLHIKAEKYWNDPDYEVVRRLEQHTKYWSYPVDNIVHGMSQEDLFNTVFLEDNIVEDQTNVKIANVLIICLGETGKGKTYTLYGLDQPWKNRGLAPRILSALFHLKTKYPSYDVTINISAVEYYKGKIYDILDTPKSIKHIRKEYKRESIESEEYGIDLLHKIALIRFSEKTCNSDHSDHHTSTVVLHLSIEVSSELSSYISVANIYLVDMEAFSNLHADNINALDIINRKYFQIKNFSKFTVKIIGTSGLEDVSTNRIKSLMCLMKSMQKSISKQTFDESSVFDKKDNLNFLKVTLRDKVDEMNGILKLAKDRGRKIKNPYVIREKYDFTKRLLLAYLDDKVNETIIINLSVDIGAQFIYEMCKRLFEPLRLSLKNEEEVVQKQVEEEFFKNFGLSIAYGDGLSSNDDSDSNEDEEEEVEEEQDDDDYENLDDDDDYTHDYFLETQSDESDDQEEDVKDINKSDQMPARLKLEDPLKLEPYNTVWDKFLIAYPNLKFSLENYCKEVNEFQKKLERSEKTLLNLKSGGKSKEHLKDKIIAEVRFLKTQVTLVRKKIVQIYRKNQSVFDDFCVKNNVITLPEESSDFSNPSQSTTTDTSLELKSTSPHEFDNYLKKLLQKNYHDLAA